MVYPLSFLLHVCVQVMAAQEFAEQRVGVFRTPAEMAAAADARRKVERALVRAILYMSHIPMVEVSNVLNHVRTLAPACVCGALNHPLLSNVLNHVRICVRTCV